MTNPFRLASGHILSHVSKTMQGSCRRYHYIKRSYVGFEKHSYSAFGIYNERPARILQPQPTMTQFFDGCQMVVSSFGMVPSFCHPLFFLSSSLLPVILANAGIQGFVVTLWIPVFTGMTIYAGMTLHG